MFKKRGFTLVEVLLVIVIIGIFAAIIMPRIIYSRTEAQKQACNANGVALNALIQLYHAQEKSWPATLNDLVATGEGYLDEIPTCPFNVPYVYNTTSHSVAKHTHP